MVYPWMCSPDCPCYPGENNETRDGWMAYGNEGLFAFGRNADSVNVIDESRGNASTTPFQWTSDPFEASLTYK